uniref:Uncharacterized protein n=1 Tax=Anguilla anguilla TaxID=7936 RepID=A0A0E9PVW9_ANGAN
MSKSRNKPCRQAAVITDIQNINYTH